MNKKKEKLRRVMEEYTAKEEKTKRPKENRLQSTERIRMQDIGN